MRDLCKNDTGSVSAAALYLTTDGVPPTRTATACPMSPTSARPRPAPKPRGCPDTTAPDTDFLNAPPNGIAKSLKVPFGFVSNETGVSYLCSLDGAAFATCANPTTLTVAAGRPHLQRRGARRVGQRRPLPGDQQLHGVRLPSLDVTVAQLTKALKRVKKAIKKTKAKLEHASRPATKPRSRS